MTISSGISVNRTHVDPVFPMHGRNPSPPRVGMHNYLAGLRGKTTGPAFQHTAASRHDSLADDHHRSLTSAPRIPFLTPGKPESFKSIISNGQAAHEFEFAVDDVYGTEITVNTDAKAAASYFLSAQRYDPVWGFYNWTRQGMVSPGEPIDTTKLLQPGEKYRLTIKFGDSAENSEVKGDVVIHRTSAAEAAKFSDPPEGSNLDDHEDHGSFNKFTAVPIKVGDTYEDQQFGINRGGGCYTVYPCKGQERVRVSTVLEDQVLKKYFPIRFSSRITVNYNELRSIFETSNTSHWTALEQANAMYTNDTDVPFYQNATLKREWFNEFYIGSGKPVVICVAAPYFTARANITLTNIDEGEQYLFPFSVTSLDGNNQCDLAKAFNWQHLTPNDNPVKSWLREHAKYIGPAGAGLLLMTAAFYYYKSKSQANLTNLTTASQSHYIERRTSPELPTGAPDDLRVENARVLYPSTICLSDFERDFSCISDITDAELEVAISDQTLTTLILRGCSHLTDATWDTIKQQKHLVYLDLTGCTNMSADGFLNIVDELSSLEQCHLPFNENRSETT